MSDLDTHLNYFTSGMEMHSGLCLHIVETTLERGSDERTQVIEQLRQGLFDYIREEQEYKDSVEALQATKDKVEQVLMQDDGQGAHDDLDVGAGFDEAKRRAKTDLSDVDLAKHPAMVAFESKVRQMESAEEATAEAEAEEEMDDDTDLVALTTEVSTVDPITKQQIKNPVKNKVCSHVYDRDTILALLRQNAMTRCPYTGCANQGYVHEKDLETDYRLKEVIAKQARSAAKQAGKKKKKKSA